MKQMKVFIFYFFIIFLELLFRMLNNLLLNDYGYREFW